MNIVRTIVSSAASNAAGTLIVFAGIAYYSRVLGPAEIGTFFLFQAVVGLGTIPASFGLHGAVIKRISEGKDPATTLTTALLLMSILSGFTLLALMIYNEYILNFIGENVLFLLASGLLATVFGRLSTALLKAELRVALAEYLEFGRRIIWIVIGCILVTLQWGFEAIVIGYVIGWVSVIVAGLYLSETGFGRPTIRSGRDLFEFARYDVITHIDTYLYNWLDIAIIGLFLTQASVGAYEVAWRVAALTMLVTKAIEKLLLPQISTWHSEGTIENIESSIPMMISASVIFVIPVAFGAVVLGDDVLRIIFGKGFTVATLALSILLVGKIVEAVDRVFKKVLAGLDLPELQARAVIVSIGLNVGLNIFFVPHFGLIGAASATSLSFFMSTLITGYYLSNAVELQLPWYNVSWYLLSSSLMIVLLWHLQVKPKNVFELLFIVIFGGIVYFTTCVFSSSIRDSINMAIKAVSNG